MRQKAYYKDLAEKYFDAATTLAEERELREFLAVTTDSDFDDVKTVMGFMLVAAEAYGYKTTATAGRRKTWFVAVAAVIAALIVIVPFLSRSTDDCIIIAASHTTTSHEEVIGEMDRQMAMLLNATDDNSIENDMAIIFN